MIYEWDDRKLQLNLENHKVHFSLAELFEWNTAGIEPDNRKVYGEMRYRAYGLIENRLYCLVFTPRNGQIRIISLRKANQREVQFYESKNNPSN